RVTEQQVTRALAGAVRQPHQACLADRLDQRRIERDLRPAQAAILAGRDCPAILLMVATHIEEQRSILTLDDLTLIRVVPEHAAKLPGRTVIITVNDVRT